jgi:rRNA maturation endonuclease Nob1
MDKGFNDPVVRCTECQEMIDRKTLQEHGSCPKCGNRRMRNVLTMDTAERDWLRVNGHEEFLKLFEEVA